MSGSTDSSISIYFKCCSRRRGSHADIAAARIDDECIVGGSRADMRRLDRRVRGRRIARRDLVDLRVLRAGIRQGQGEHVRADAGSRDGRVVQAGGVDGRAAQRGIPNGVRGDAADGHCAGIHGGARGQRGNRQVIGGQAADIHR